MPYKISGTTTEDCKILVIKESDWTVEATEEVTTGDYVIDSLTAGEKTVIATKTDGNTVGYGLVNSVLYDT